MERGFRKGFAVIETYRPYLEGLLRSESWRAGPGDTTSLCPGDLAFDGSAHWHCRCCGRIGLLPTTQHFPLKARPVPSLLQRFAEGLARTHAEAST